MLAIVLAGCTLWGLHRTWHENTDWVFFEVGARVLVHFQHQSIYADPRFHLYVDNADLQIGPPALWLVAALEWLPSATINIVCAVIMGLLGFVALWAMSAVARIYRPEATDRVRLSWLGVQLSIAAVWGFDCGAWKHLDDAMAIALTAVAAWLIARGGKTWWVAALLLGTAASAKPWALIFAALLVGLPRVDRAKATLVFVAAAAFWWGPFIVSAPGTIQALGHFSVFSEPRSVLWLVGIHGEVQGWLRPTQMIVGLAVGAGVAFRRDWQSAAVAALAVRVATDPYSYAYYGLGPVVFAAFADMSTARFRGWPVLSITTLVVEFGLPELGAPGTFIAIAKLIWSIGILIIICLPNRSTADVESVEETLQIPQLRPVGA